MKIRVLSDLHVDVNKTFPLSLPKDDGVFTVLAGDTSGDPNTSIPWIREHITRGIVVTGNHLVYNRQIKPIEDLRKQMADAFPIDGDVSFLECVDGGAFCKVVDGALFLGSCLYTDMKFESVEGFTKTDIKANERIALFNMNDFRFGLKRMTEGCDERVAIEPFDYERWFDITVKAFDFVLTELEKANCPMPCVVVTHHAPSALFIPEKYKFSPLNASYVSDLEWFIEKHKSIKCWICGHIHGKTRMRYTRKDKSKVLLLNNSRGYVKYGEDRDFEPSLVVDTETWRVSGERNGRNGGR